MLQECKQPSLDVILHMTSVVYLNSLQLHGDVLFLYCIPQEVSNDYIDSCCLAVTMMSIPDVHQNITPGYFCCVAECQCQRLTKHVFEGYRNGGHVYVIHTLHVLFIYMHRQSVTYCADRS